MLNIRCGFEYLHMSVLRSLLLVGQDLESPRLTVKFVTWYGVSVLQSVLMV